MPRAQIKDEKMYQKLRDEGEGKNKSARIANAAASRKKLVGDGTNFIASTETWAVPGTSGNVLTSDGTNTYT